MREVLQRLEEQAILVDGERFFVSPWSRDATAKVTER